MENYFWIMGLKIKRKFDETIIRNIIEIRLDVMYIKFRSDVHWIKFGEASKSILKKKYTMWMCNFRVSLSVLSLFYLETFNYMKLALGNECCRLEGTFRGGWRMRNPPLMSLQSNSWIRKEEIQTRKETGEESKKPSREISYARKERNLTKLRINDDSLNQNNKIYLIYALKNRS